MKLGLTALMLIGSVNALAAEDLRSTGLAPEPVTNEVVPTDPATMSTSSTMLSTDASMSSAVNDATMAVTKATEATEAARIANEAAKVANDVAKMATDKAVEATEVAKKAMDSTVVGGAASSGMGTDSSMTGDVKKKVP